MRNRFLSFLMACTLALSGILLPAADSFGKTASETETAINSDEENGTDKELEAGTGTPLASPNNASPSGEKEPAKPSKDPVGKVRDMLDALPTEDELQDMSEEKLDLVYEQLETAREAYEDLGEDEKALLENAEDRLNTLDLFLAYLQEEDGDLIDDEEMSLSPLASPSNAAPLEAPKPLETAEERAEKVQDMLDALPTEDELQDMSQKKRNRVFEQIETARKAYEDLSEDEKALIQNAEDILTPLYVFFSYPLELNGKILVEVTDQFELMEPIKFGIEDPYGISLIAEKYGALKDGTYEKWIDRVELPQYARDFYDDLEEGSDNDGNDDWVIDDSYFSADEAVPTPWGNVNRYIIQKIDEKDPDIINKNIRLAYTGFSYDHPEVFWLDNIFITRITVESDSVKKTEYTVVRKVHDGTEGWWKDWDWRLEEFRSASSIKNMIKFINQRTSEIINGAGSRVLFFKLKEKPICRLF